jgi:hypothetical protein
MGSTDRRRRDRRGLEAIGTGALLATLALAAGSAQAQIYTRRNERGVMEATNAPDETDYRLAPARAPSSTPRPGACAPPTAASSTPTSRPPPRGTA